MYNHQQFYYEGFLSVYMYGLEEALMNHIEEIETISFHSDEANTDKQLKEFLKGFIEMKFNHLPSQILQKTLILKHDELSLEKSCKAFENIYIKHVYLQNEITEELKQRIKNSKKSVYTNPDLLVECTDGNSSAYFSIEVKSTKKDSIPGSSIQQINENEWVIFVKHTKHKIEITTGRYINSINNILRFPDRSPRPEVSFNEMKRWNENYRKGNSDIICYTVNSDTIKEKQLLLEDWQNFLADKWIQILFQEDLKKNEPWFNVTLRKCAEKLIDKYDHFSLSEKESFKKRLRNSIKKKSKKN